MEPTVDIVIDRTWDGLPVRADERVSLRVERAEGGLEVRVDAPLHGDPAPGGPAGATEALWEYEVVELFLLGAGEHYLEVELGPHGHHLVLELSGVRRRVRSGLALEYEVARVRDRWLGRARLPEAWLPRPLLRANAYAVHGVGAGRRYLAWQPVASAAEAAECGPDFHRLACFAPIEL